ncbi:MAG: DUF4191 domain-containing protein [Microbacterium sp.]|jgi:hypothetical protein|uniref:DUF4191 domain-containing protein n=1 Tax=unclassified Microbacterium TaxID=2609290 RepID=UPI000DB505E3|nr:DUF4191 domain-containing protein [Microbacterium sp.]PZU38161.1 MAG: DUF4191 domain-containing protein [Microbacterium sp.]
MAARSTAPEKRPGFFSQIRSLYSFTQQEFRFLPWLLIGILVVAIGLGILLGFLIQPVQWWTVLLWGITGLLAGVLISLMTMTRLSTRAMYVKLDGMPGAVGHVISTFLGRGWTASEMPVGVNPKTQDAVYRVIGRGGVVIIGEGAKGRLSRLVGDERSKVTRVAHGVPVHVFYIGHGDGEVPIKDLAKTIKSLPKKLDKATIGAVIKRVDSISQGLNSLPIPKGIDPTKVRAPRPR